MNYWIDIAAIVFACTTANHLGLIKTVEGIIKRSLPILNCPMCSSFWFTLAYSVCRQDVSLPLLPAISFLAAYSAIWLELLEGYVDTYYNKLYEKITNNDGNDAAAADDGETDTGSAVSGMQQTSGLRSH